MATLGGTACLRRDIIGKNKTITDVGPLIAQRGDIVCVGNGSSVSGPLGIAIGFQSSVSNTSDRSIVIGSNVVITGSSPDVIFIGNSPTGTLNAVGASVILGSNHVFGVTSTLSACVMIGQVLDTTGVHSANVLLGQNIVVQGDGSSCVALGQSHTIGASVDGATLSGQGVQVRAGSSGATGIGQSIVIDASSNASTAIGANIYVGLISPGTVAVGQGIDLGGGEFAVGNSINSVAIGQSLTSGQNNQYTILLGSNNTIGVGLYADPAFEPTRLFVIGSENTIANNVTKTTVLGSNNSVGLASFDLISIGDTNTIGNTTDHIVMIGQDLGAQLNVNNSVIVGNTITVPDEGVGIFIGQGPYTIGNNPTNVIMIGYQLTSIFSADLAVNIGNINTVREYGVVIGCSSLAYNSAVAIGNGATVSQERGVGVGPSTVVTGIDGIAIGTSASSTLEGIAIGVNAVAMNQSVAIGLDAVTLGAGSINAIAIGTGTSANGLSAIAIGNGASAITKTCVIGGVLVNTSIHLFQVCSDVTSGAYFEAFDTPTVAQVGLRLIDSTGIIQQVSAAAVPPVGARLLYLP